MRTFASLGFLGVVVALFVFLFIREGVLAGFIALAGLGASIAVTLSPLASTRRWLERVGTFLPAAAFIIALFAIDDTRPHDGFNEAAAQIIPVLVLALAIDARVFSLRRFREGADAVTGITVLLFLAGGEYVALQGLYSGVPEGGDIVGGAIAAGFVGLGVAALTDRKAEETEPPAQSP